ncbi:hypothetical protein CEXT_128301 [Caerostris extrusa]|uniref:Ribosomal protein L14 n=1 Tax=Caerostris extrusa TaxID=172846 RepID=A0AAV4XNC3_CAEEX|nr:hypothetical protein CEXT_128301 [Caerostris extrusa]
MIMFLAKEKDIRTVNCDKKFWKTKEIFHLCQKKLVRVSQSAIRMDKQDSISLINLRITADPGSRTNWRSSTVGAAGPNIK